MYPLNVRLIKVGTCIVDPSNMASTLEAALKVRLGIGGGSSVALIRQEGATLLVDTGFEFEGDPSPENAQANAQALTARLTEHGTRLDDITHVFLTHFHRDHAGNLPLFPRAQWSCHRQALADYAGPDRDRFHPLEEGDAVIPRTTVLFTPGHPRGHASLLWAAEDKKLRVAICGDAILSLAWLQSGHIWRFSADFFDLGATKQSAVRLRVEADLLIPGHGEPFFARESHRLAAGFGHHAPPPRET